MLPRPTQNSGWISLIVAKNNEFVREGNEQQRGASPEEEIKEEKVDVIKWMNQSLSTSWPKQATITQEMLLFTFFSLNVLLVSFLSLGTWVCIPLSVNPPFLIYYFHHHPYLTGLLSRHLSLFKSEEGGEGVCLVVTHTIQITSSSMQLIKLLPTI